MKVSHLETPLNLSINNDLNKAKLNDISKTSCSSNIPEQRRNMRSKIPENKKLTNKLENIRKIKSFILTESHRNTS